jgi:hypothetical protein
MGITTVMMKTIMKPAFLMEEIVVDLMSIQNTAHNVNVLKEEGELLEVAISIGLVMEFAMISTTI